MIKRTHLLLTVIYYILTTSVYAQNYNVDSLKILLSKAKQDSNKVNLLNLLGGTNGISRDTSTVFNYLDQSVLLAKKISYYKGLATSYRLKCTSYYNLSLYFKTLEYATLCMEISKQHAIYLEQARSLIYLSTAYSDIGNDKTAARYAIEGLELSKKINFQKGLVTFYCLIAAINDIQGQFVKSLKYYKLALSLITEGTDGKSAILSNIGALYVKQKQYDSAMFYFSKAEKINLEANVKGNLLVIYVNIGECYSLQNKEEDALHYYNLALKQEAVSPDEGSRLALHINIGTLYLKKNKLDLAEKNLLKASVMSTKILNKQYITECEEKLAELYSRKGNFKLALKHYKTYMKLNKELFNETQLKEINKSIANYEVELKEKEIRILTSEKKQKQAEEKAAKSKRRSVYFILALGVIVLLFFAAYLNSRNEKNKKKKFAYLLLQSQEDERKRIAKELHDGIGQTLLAIKGQTANKLIDLTIEELRNISRNLHPIQLEKLGLKAAIESIIKDASAGSPIYFSSEIDNLDQILSPQIQINIYRIIQECVSNILKHSQATAARVIIKKTSRIFNIIIFDNGIGFNVSANKNRKSLGLSYIKERVDLINGKLHLHSKSGETKIEIEIKNV